MAEEKMIKHLFFTYGKSVPNPLYHEGSEDQPKDIIVEGIGRLGQVVEIEREYDLNRGEELDAFYTDDERQAIEEGTYSGDDAEVVLSAIASESGLPTVTTGVPTATGGVEAVTPIADMSDEEIAAMIQRDNLNVDQTIALAGNDPEQMEKVLDAEDLLENGPRKGVTSVLEKKIADATTGESEE